MDGQSLDVHSSTYNSYQNNIEAVFIGKMSVSAIFPLARWSYSE